MTRADDVVLTQDPPQLVDAYPMSELQVGMVYEMERDPERLPYHNVHTLRVAGAFDERCFRRAVAGAVVRHPILRTSFALVGFSEPMQLVYDAAEVPLVVVDLRGLDAAPVLSSYVDAERRTPLDVSVAPLCRMGVHVLSDTAFHWTFTEHHSILDGWSLASLVSEITDAYRLLLAGGEPEFTPPQSTYRDYIAAERAALESPESTEFWRGRLAEPPDGRLPRWPADRPVLPAADPVTGERHTHDAERGYGSLVTPLPADLPARLRELARSCRVPVKAVLLAAHVKAMSLVTGSADVVVGLTANGRLEEEGGADVVGLFVNTLPFRVRTPDGTWRDLIRTVFDTENDLLPHRRYPMGALQRDLGGAALFETNFVYTDFQQIPAEGDDVPAGDVARTHFALVAAFVRQPGGEGLNLEVEYDARALAAAQVALLRGYHLRVLAEMVADPDADHRWASLLGASERDLLESWNATAGEVPATPVHRLVEERVALSPDAVALVSGAESLTYRDLNARANRLAHRLRDLGVGPDVAVGVCVDRSVEMVVGWLAVLKAGGLYVPLDPAFPASRLEYMLDRAAAPLVLTVESTVPEGPWRVLTIEDLPGDSKNLDGGAGPDHGAYVIFTSGSTGRPKGVVTRHRNVTELLHGGDTMTLRPDDTLLQIASASFDVSTFEVWAPLVGGAKLVLAPAVRYGPQEIAEWVAESGVTVLHATASLFALLVDHEPRLFDGLRRILTGSETVSPAHVARILERCPDLEVVNCWGPTETTTFSVCGSFRRGDVPAGPLPLGVPLVNTEVWVLDDAGRPVPVGSPGELCVSGPCLARGYLGQPGLTAERFLPHPVRAGERLYRTGDLGRWSPDGRVEFLGRVDHMVKVRGFRVELGEVEAALRDHPALRDCVVVTRPNSSAGVDLVAYLVADGDAPSTGEVRAWLGERLPSYMVPRLFVFLDVLPLTSNAKVDRRALPDPDEARPDVAQEFVPPVGAIEELLAGIWSQVLGVDRVGRHDNFFDLGGDSIRSIQVLGEAREAGLTAGLATMLANPTPAGLAAALEDAVTATRSEPFSVLAADDRALLPDGLEDAYPMAELQVGMVYEMERDPERRPYHNVHTLRLTGTFDETAFRAALARVTARHPVLRTSFAMSRFSVPVQLVHPTAEIPLTVVDLRGTADARAAVDEHLAVERRTPLDLTVAPLCRMTVHVLADDAFQWTVTEHHAILDGWSLTSTLAEISTTYEGLLAGHDPRPVPLRSTYRDFIAAEYTALASPASRDYWRDLLAGSDGSPLPRWSVTAPLGDVVPGERHEPGSLVTTLPAELRVDVEVFARRAGVPFKTAVLAAHLRALAAATGGQDVTTGLSFHGRLEEADGTEVRGLFLNTLPFRVVLPDGTWHDLARAVLQAERDVLPHRRYPMAALQRDLGRASLFDVGFVYNDFHQFGRLADGGGAWRLDSADQGSSGSARTSFPLLVSVSREAGTAELRLEMEYDPRQITPDQAVLLRDQHLRALQAMTADPSARHAAVPLVGGREERHLTTWSREAVEVDGATTVPDLVAAASAARPDAVALTCDGVSLTYRELADRADLLAHRLRRLGVGPEVCVGVFLERSWETVVACLAVLRAGGVYVPLDTAFPADRLEFMLRDVGAPLVVVHAATAATVPSGPWELVDLRDTTVVEATEPPVVHPDNACYVIFTSGSTGRPKGTTITHRNVVRLLRGVRENLPFGQDDVWTLFHSFAFDFSVWEMWGALTTGGRLVVVPYAVSRDVEAFHALVRDERVTILSQTPSAFRQFETADERHGGDLALRAVVFGGEALHRPSVRRWASRHGYAAPLLVNMYGITETTVHVTYLELDAGHVDGDTSPIGVPLPDLGVHVLDGHGNPCPVGVTGELHVSGAGLARGYTGLPALTAQRFVPDPVSGSRLYRSGDLARWNALGGLEYLGRADTQVKIRGYRIETGEIENVLATHVRVLEAAVTTRTDAEGRTDLIAYLVPDGAPPSLDEVRAWLGERLPDYMVPRHFVTMDALPLTPQGKVDRRALPEPGADRPELGQRYEPPTGDLETLLADVWRRVLGVDRVGRHDNYFDLGGDSIRSIQILGRVRDAGFAVGLQDLLGAPTVAGLAATLAPAEEATTASEPFSLLADDDRALLPEGLDDAYPMAQLQVGMVYEMERDRARNAYHNVETLRLAGRFDERLFRAAVDRTVGRHPVLRTSFDLVGFSEPMQLVHARVEVPFTVVDLRRATAEQRRSALVEFVREQQAERFAVTDAPLFRMAVHVLADDAFQWTVTEHHAILDGWSMVSTLAEITDRYRRLLDGERPPAEPLRSLYRDFVAAERAALDSAESREFWRDRLAEVPDGRIARWDADLTGDRVEGERHVRDEAAGHGALSTPLPADLLLGLEAFAARAAVPVKTVVLAAHLRVLGLFTGSPDVLVGLTSNGRLEETDGSEARGLFLNTVPLRVRLPEGSWLDLAHAVHDAERDLSPHRRYPLAALQREFGGDRPLFESNFTYNNFHRIARIATDGTIDRSGDDPVLPGIARTNFPLDVTFSREPGSDALVLEIAYSLDGLTAGQVTRLRDSHLRALRALVADAGAHHRASPLTGPEDDRLLASWQGAAAPVSGLPVHEVLRSRVGLWPDAVAVESGEDRLTFAELDARSEVLARRLVAAGVARGDVVGLHLRPGVVAVLAVWAVWKAGGAFLPLDPELPTARLDVMVADAGPTVVVSLDPTTPWRTVSPESAEAVPDVVLPRVGGHDPAYLMFTSGSTGRPKGVLVEHGNLANFAEALLLPRMRSAGVVAGQGARVLTGTSAFISDFFLSQVLPLLDGHRLVVQQGRDPRHLVALAQDPERAVDVIDATTSQVRLMVEAGLLDAPHPPRLISIGGEACPPDLWDALRGRAGTVVHNTYGPAETAVDATFADLGAHGSSVIGRPYGNVRVHLVDEALGLVPPGSVGEIVIGGPSVGRGYVRRPGVTAAVFVPDPWGEPGSRLYRTGDLGRYTADGQIEFLGRGDHQVKILGQRVELEEVEAVLRGHPAVEAAAVTAHRVGPDGRLRLVAHLVGTVDRDDVRAYLAERLPAAAIPSVLVTVDALPLTVGGKLDRAALTVPDDADLPQRDVVEPRTDTERRIAAVWSTLLGVSRVGVHDDFFTLGGHSLLAIRLAMRISADLGADLPLHEVFARPTVAGQAELIDQHTGAVAGIPHVEGRELPASHAQERQWFLWQLAPKSSAYHVPWGYEVRGDLDTAVLDASVAALVDRHEAFRTTLHADAEGQVLQRVGTAAWTGLTALDADETEVPALVDRAVSLPFDLGSGPVLRVTAWRTAPDRHVVLFVAHHVAVDEWSIDVFEQELWALYRAGGDLAAAGLAPLDVRYADYAVWHRERVEQQSEVDLAYWRQVLDGAPPPWPHTTGRKAAAAGASHAVPAEALAGLDRVRAEVGATDFMVYLAVYFLLLARRSGERDLTMGIPVSGRAHADLAPVVGFFVNTLALRVVVHPEDDFARHLDRVREAVLGAFAHQDAPFEQVVRAVAADRAESANPLFHTLFSFATGTGLTDRLADHADLELRDLPIEGSGSRFDLSLGATRTAEGLHLTLQLDTALFEAPVAGELVSTFAALLHAIGESPRSAVADVLRATDDEQRRLAAWTGDVTTPASTTPVHELFRRSAARWPDAVAVEAGDERLTFAELDERSDVLARRLVAAGAGRGAVVGLHLRPGFDAVVSVWAAWKAGGAFLPLDPELPAVRLEVMADDAAPAVVVTLDPTTVPGSWPTLAPTGEDAPDAVLPVVGERDLAYVMFTSGSTGRPKGVMVDHGNLATYAEVLLLPRMRRAGIAVGQQARVLTGTSAFISDFFLTQILPLLDGHLLLVVSGVEGRDPRHLVALAQDPDRAVDVIDVATSQVQVMVEAGLLDTPHPPRMITFGGEACPPDLWQAFRDHPDVVGHNQYGPAETTVDVAYADADEHESPVIGRPYGNARIHLVDEHLHQVPPGSVGEIVIGGPNVGRGYVRRPGVTAAVFVPDPWGEPGSRLYRTGDLGRHSVDGRIEFLGRNDHQVKVQGQRVEPEEVEAVLRGYPSVEAAAVSAHRSGANGRVRLVAHLVLAHDAVLDRDRLREHLAGLLPAAAVPTVFAQVDALPMTVGGKLDRLALTAPDDVDATVVVTPRTATELRIADAWQAVLGDVRFGVHDDFFSLGGHSLLAVRLAMRVRAELGVDLALHEVFAHPTVAGQAELIDRSAAAGVVAGIPRVDRGGDLPASHAQERQWFLWQLDPASSTYHVPWGYRVDGDLDVAAVGAAVEALVDRHEAFRTTLHLDEDGRVVHRVGTEAWSGLTVLDAVEADLPGLVDAEVRRPFDLGAGPVLRVTAWRTAPDRHVVLFVAHHIAVDEWSLDVVEQEFWALYRAGGDVAAAGLAPLTVTYTDYAAWHRDLVASRAEEDLAYWRQALRGTTSSWPHALAEPAALTAGEVTHTVPADALTGLDRVRAEVGATDFMVYLAVYFLLLARQSGDREFTVGVPVSGRSHADLAPLVGFFVNTLALRVEVDPDDDFAAHLGRVREAVLGAFAHQEAPFEQVVRAVAPERAESANPLFRTMFSFTEGGHHADRPATGGLTLGELPLGGGTDRFDLSLSTTRTADGLHLTLEFGAEYFAAPAAEDLVTAFVELLDAVAGSPSTTVAEFLRANPREQDRLDEWAGQAAGPVDHRVVHESFRDRVALWPDAVAVEAGDERLSYGDLDERSEVLARRLVAAGVRRGDVVGLHLRPGVDAVIAVWAAWKSGGAFLPLDPELPPAQLAVMVEDAAPAAVLTLDASTVPASWPVLSPASDVDAPDVALPVVGARDLAYVMFTSGSTGRPKGVLVDHGNLANFAEALLLPRMRAAGLDVGGQGRVLTGTSAFISDFFLSQILPLIDGHRLVVLSGAEGRDPRRLVELAQDPERAIDLVDATTSQVQVMVEAGLLDAPHPPKLIAFGGEACPPDLWHALREHPTVVAQNLYGPAETTVDVTCANLGETPSPVIGRPYGNARVRLVDEALCPVPPGAVGEIVIGGPNVGRGYVRRPGATAAVFVPDPWGEPGSRLYRTGDLGRYTVDGRIEFLGRDDHQVKIQGQRVELEGVEAALRGHPAIDAAAVGAHRLGADGRLRLVAHLVVAEGSVLDRDAIREHLAGLLPAAAIPTVLVPVDALPMTAGGKVDRLALTVPDDLGPIGGHVVEPRTVTEQGVADAWRAVLGDVRFGVHEDFFSLGGHSLLAVRLAMRVRAELGVDLALHEVFAHPTVAGQADLIDRSAAAGVVAGIPRVDRGGDLPASHAQERQWFLWQLDPESPTYHVPWGYEVRGHLDPVVLEAAVVALVDRHEAFRTTLHLDDDGRVVQRVGTEVWSGLTVLDAVEAEVPDLVDREARRPFDLSVGPVLRVTVWRTAPDRHTVLFVAHHVAIDEWSSDLVEQEFWALYRAGGDVAAAGLAPLTVTYTDYAAWHRDLVERQSADDLAYWRAALDNAPAPWPRGSARGGEPAFEASSRTVPADALTGLDRVRAEVGATDFTVYLAVYFLLLARRSGERDLTVGVPVSGRTHADLAPLVGFFVNTLALRVVVRPEDDFTAHLERVREVVLGAFAHQEAPFEQVVRAVAPERAESANPLFRTMFSFTAGTDAVDRAAGNVPVDLVLRDLPIEGSANRFDLSLATARTTDGLDLSLALNTGLVEVGAAEELAASFADLLDVVGRNPRVAVAELLRANDREQRRVAEWTGDTSAPVGVTPVHELFRRSAARWPDAVAVEAGHERLTFAELDERSDVLARRLVAAGVRRGDVVGLHLRPGVDAVVAVWAAWKAGGAFLPLDPELPAARLDVMVADALPTAVVSLDPTTVPGSRPVLSPESDVEAPEVDLPSVGPLDLAYVMFTSGSTGRPKGVMVDHGGLANYAEVLLLPRMREAGLDVGGQARVLTGTSAFISDFFLTQILPLIDGHLLLVVSGVEGRDPRHLVEQAQDPERAVDVIDVAMSQVQVMVEAGLLDAPHPPKLIAFGGEACPPDLWQAFRDHPDVVAHNMYGPAEATVDAAYADIGAHLSPVIGRPYGNVRVHLVDEHLHQVPPGTPGEIVIGGPGVGRGYVRRPGVTAAAFVPDPWGEPGSRLYRTGDLGRYTADGQVEFLGRTDHQVKIQGQRVEPEEVEAALRAHPSIEAAAVSAHRSGADTRLRLVAHLVLAHDAVLDRDRIREHLLGRLPAAAVPTVLVPVDALPMTVGGKLDRLALAAPDDSGLPRRDVVAPRNGTERRIADAWRAVLGSADFGVHDDFFALGGHSLLAIRLTMALSREFATGIPLAHLYTASTIAEQADRIDGLLVRGGPAESRVVPLGGVRGARPLVLVHPVGGTLFSYRDLLGEVSADFEAFGVQGDIGGDSGATGLAGLAERYADDLVPVLGDREPVVAGWSAGGVVAHALARALTDRGIHVHRLLLVDSDPRPTADVEAERRDIATLDALRDEVLDEGPAPLLRFDGADRLFATLGVDPAAVAGLDGPTAAALIAFWRDMFTGLVDHRPRAFDGPADLVLASGAGGDLIAEAWRGLTGTLSVTHVDGDHFQLMRRPRVKAVADALRGSTAQTGD